MFGSKQRDSLAKRGRLLVDRYEYGKNAQNQVYAKERVDHKRGQDRRMDMGIFFKSFIIINMFELTRLFMLRLFKSPLQIQIDFEIENDVDDLSDILANHSSEYFAWCGYDFDVRTLDVYFNFDKYFASQDNLNNRINSTNNYRNAFVTFNSRFLRLFSMHLRHLVLDTRINSASAVLGNCVDMFAFSAIRFLIMTKQMPYQVFFFSYFKFIL